MTSGGVQPTLPDSWVDVLARLHTWGGSDPFGPPEAVQTLADLPGLSSSTALYDFGASLSVVVADLAQALTLLASEPDAIAGCLESQNDRVGSAPLTASSASSRRLHRPVGDLPTTSATGTTLEIPRWIREGATRLDETVGKLHERLAAWDQWVSDLATLMRLPAEDPLMSLTHCVGPLSTMRDAVVLVRDAIVDLNELHHQWHPQIVQLLRSARPLTDGDETGRHLPQRGLWERGDNLTSAQRHQLRAMIELLTCAEHSVRERIHHAADLLPTSENPCLSTWLPCWSTPTLDAQRWRLAQPETPRGAKHLRSVLGADDWSPTPVRALHHLLTTNPGVGLLLTRAHTPTDAPVQLQQALTAPTTSCTPEEWMRWALLWPGIVGPCPGAPVAARVQANRLLVRAALIDARREDLRFERLLRNSLTAHPARLWSRVRVWLRTAWSRRENLSSLWALPGQLPAIARDDLRTRIRVYESMLHQPGPAVPNHTGWPRQLLQFDPHGNGRAVELCGRLDEQTQRLVILVPGTGTTARGFHMPAGFAADVVRAEPSGRTAAIAWMGADFPQGFANQSPLAHYAGLAAAPLCDFIDGLPLPAGCEVILVGHSYGGVIVGAADKRGVRADRIIHAASAGSGPGVARVEDYASHDHHGRPRQVRRYCLSVPGDYIAWAHTVHRLVLRLPHGLAHRLTSGLHMVNRGIDPGDLRGIITLNAGVWEQPLHGHQVGQRLHGPAGHSSVTTPGTTAFAEIMRVVIGEK